MKNIAAKACCCSMLAALAAVPLRAQPPGRDAGARGGGDRVTVGLGLGVSPSYLGADNYRLIPGGALQGSVKGHDFRLNGLQLFVDAIPNRGGGQWALDLGPVAGVRLDRNGSVSDARVAALGKRNAAVELGIRGAIGRRAVLSRTDQLSVAVTGVADVAKAHGSVVVTPAIQYSFLPDRRSYMQLSLSAELVGDDFARYYFEVTPAAASASGLAVHRPKGGLASLGSSLFATRSLSGGRTGWGVFGIVSYRRLQGDIAASSIVRQTGSANQLFGSAGLAYTF